MLDWVKNLFKKKEKPLSASDVVASRPKKTGKTRLDPVRSTRETEKYDPTRETVFPIDMNIRGMEAIDCICLLAGFSFSNNKWHPVGNDHLTSIERTEVAKLSDETIDYLNGYSTLLKVTCSEEKLGDRIQEIAHSYQEKLLDLDRSEVIIGDVRSHAGKFYLNVRTIAEKKAMFIQGRVCLLGPNLQVRYILEVVNHIGDDEITCKVLGINTRAPKSRDMFLVEL